MITITPLSSIQGAIWGQFVGDAAGLGTHWIYDLDDLAAQFPGGIQGFETPGPGHYHDGKISGDQTHYGDAALLLLESLAACGEFRASDFGCRFEGYFRGPTCRSYKDHATRETLANLEKRPGNFQNGADDDEMSGVTRLAPVAVTYQKAPMEEYTDIVQRVTLVTQNHKTADACSVAHAVLLRFLLEGRPFRLAFEAARKSSAVTCDGSDYFEFAHMLRDQDVVTATGRIGQTCHLPQSFPAALHAAWRHHDDFQTAILETLRAGGDNAGRAALVGAWIGAVNGIEGIPGTWIARLRHHDRIAAAITQLLTKLDRIQKPG